MEKIIQILLSPITVIVFIIALTFGLVVRAIWQGFRKAERIIWKDP